MKTLSIVPSTNFQVVREASISLDDKHAQDAYCIADHLCGARLIRSSDRTDAAKIIAPILRQIPESRLSLDPEILKLKREELDLKRQNTNLARELRKDKAKQRQFANGMVESFFKIARDLLDTEQFIAIRDLAESEARRQD